MKILNLSLDQSLLDSNSKSAERIKIYSEMVEKYLCVVPSRNVKKNDLSNRVEVLSFGGKDKFCQFLRIHFGLKKLLKRENFDLVTVQDQYYLGLLAYLLARKFKLALEIQVHGFEKFNGLRKLLAKFILPKADTIRTVSRRTKNELREIFSIKEEKITVVPIFLDLKINNHQYRQEKNGFVFLTASRLVKVKQIELQIKAIAELLEDFPEIKLQIVGDGPEKNVLENLSQRLNLKEKVEFLGWQEDLSNFYSQADCFLLTSNYEGYGLVIVEAASFGLPIIMTDVGCAGEFVISNENGLVVEKNNLKELKTAMTKILQNKEFASQLGENAQKAYKNLPTKEENLQLYLRSWKIALKESRD